LFNAFSYLTTRYADRNSLCCKIFKNCKQKRKHRKNKEKTQIRFLNKRSPDKRFRKKEMKIKVQDLTCEIAEQITQAKQEGGYTA
jgi:hypothetical protein